MLVTAFWGQSLSWERTQWSMTSFSMGTKTKRKKDVHWQTQSACCRAKVHSKQLIEWHSRARKQIYIAKFNRWLVDVYSSHTIRNLASYISRHLESSTPSTLICLCPSETGQNRELWHFHFMLNCFLGGSKNVMQYLHDLCLRRNCQSHILNSTNKLMRVRMGSCSQKLYTWVLLC